jgi:hypothetical protein
MLQLSCDVLALPRPSFGQWNNVQRQFEVHQPTGEQNGVSRWKMPYKACFFRPNDRPLTCLFVVQNGFELKHADRYVESITAQLQSKCGLSAVTELPRERLHDLERASINKILAKAKGDGAKLVLFMLRKPDIPFYVHLKDLADRYHGMHSLCMVKKGGFLQKEEEKQKGRHMFQEYITNVVMKVNLKMGGITQSVRSVSDYLEQNQVMILGGMYISLMLRAVGCANTSVS